MGMGMGIRKYLLPGEDGDGSKVVYPLGLGMGMGINFYYGDGPYPPHPIAIPRFKGSCDTNGRNKNKFNICFVKVELFKCFMQVEIMIILKEN